jgi:transposase
VILDNYGPHKHPKTRAWLRRHPPFVFHYTPTSASWLNAVEGFFAKLTKRRLKHGVFCSIVDLQTAINRFLRETNDDPKPSSGPPILRRSSPRSNAGTKR